MKMKLISAGLVAALTACGPLNEGTITAQVIDLAQDQFSAVRAPQAPDLVVSAEDLRANPGKYMRVNTRAEDRWDTYVIAAENGARTTWINGREISLTLENGFVVATRGLPRDLMGADIEGTRAAVRAGGGETVKTYDFLTDQDSISTQLLQCRIDSKGPEVIKRQQESLDSVRFEEVCSGENVKFTNIYWLNRNGGILRSLQAISPDAGYLQIDVF